MTDQDSPACGRRDPASRQDQSHRPAAVPGGAAQRLPSRRRGGAGGPARQNEPCPDNSRRKGPEIAGDQACDA